MQTIKTHWPSLIILVVFGIGAAFLFLLFASLGLRSIIDLFGSGIDPAGQMIAASAYGFEILVLIVCSWFVLQRARGREKEILPFKLPYAEWQIIAAIGVIVISILIGEAAAYTKIDILTWLALPFLTILVIVSPIWILFGMGTKGIDLGKRWHVFTILGLSMTIGPALMIVLEMIVLITILVTGGIYIAVQQPLVFKELISLSKILQRETNPDAIFNLIAPYIKNPFVIGTLIGYIAVLVPLIEELFKPLAVWIFAKKLTSPAQGFAMGMLSGGAFALIESLNASSDGSLGWAAIVSIRAGTSLLHMTVSGLVGWGIASAVLEKRISRFFAAYFTAASIHGIWNACAAGAGLSFVGESIGKPEWLGNYAPAFVCGMIVLGIGMFAVLIASNRKLRSSPHAESPNTPQSSYE
jgi:hypothetical protein